MTCNRSKNRCVVGSPLDLSLGVQIQIFTGTLINQISVPVGPNESLNLSFITSRCGYLAAGERVSWLYEALLKRSPRNHPRCPRPWYVQRTGSMTSMVYFPFQKKSREETCGEGSGVEILENRPYMDGPGGNGQYTHKVYHIGMHIPSWFRSILPKAALRVEEESWNAYPYTRTR